MTKILIEVDVQRVSGLFVSKDDLAEAIITTVEDADLEGLGANGDSEYEVIGARQIVTIKRPEATMTRRADLIRQHIPSLTAAAEARIDETLYEEGEIEYANAAKRDCACGKEIDGFYEYVDHLKEVLK